MKLLFFLAQQLAWNLRLKLTIAAIATLRFVIPAFSQIYTHHVISDLPQLGNSTTAWADYNNDGYPDCLISGTKSNGDYTTELFRNNGNGTFTLYSSFTSVTRASIVWGDVNGDNFQDFHLTGLTVENHPISELYINQGNETFELHTIALEGVAYGSSALVDFDQDGDLDLLYAGVNAGNQNVCKYYDNQDSLWAEAVINIPGFSYGSLDIADYNRDGLPDLLLTGLLDDGKRATRIYRNLGKHTFSEINTVLPMLAFGEAAWGDFNHDGYADIALSGITEVGNVISKLYQNNQNGVFTDIEAGLIALSNSSVAWLDYDNDGYSDLLITGLRNSNAETYLYHNNQDNSFSPISNTGLLAVYDGDISTTDYDRDGTTDVLITGYNNRGGESHLHTNSLANINTIPSIPNGLMALPRENSVQIQWNQASDAETPLAGLSYQVYIGTAAEQSDLVPAHALFSDGTRTLNQVGNAGYETELSFYSVPEGRYYWAVQSIDPSNNSSAFSAIDSFDICYSIQLGADTAICAGNTIDLQLGKSGDRVDWQSAGGVVIENQRSVSFTFFQTDTLYATLTNSLDCVMRDTLIVQVHDLPVVDLGMDTSICVSESLVLSAGQPDDEVNWYSLKQGLLASDTTHIQYVGENTDTLWAEVINPNGCISSDTIIVSINQYPLADAGDDQLICKGESITLGSSAQAGYTYFWQPSASLSDAAIPQPEASPDATTQYVLQVINESGCISYDTVTITVNPPTRLDAGEGHGICQGESTVLGGQPTAQGAILDYHYEWFPKASLDNAYLPNPTATPEQTTEYMLVAQAGECQPDTAYVTITVHDLPQTTSSEDITIGAGEATQLNASGGQSYHWFPADGLSRTDIADPFASPQVTTDYVVTVTNAYGCSSLDTVIVYVDNRIFIPNLFSPNGDGDNDTFKVYGAGIETLDLQVYDRQGKRVYHSSDVVRIMENGWDGTSRGAPLPSGHYRWVIQGKFYDGKAVTFEGAHSGKIRLIR